MEPDSNQQSKTSGILVYSSPSILNFILSNVSLCRSVIFLPESLFISSIEPRTFILLDSDFQIGIAVAQYLFRVMFQSGAVEMLCCIRPSLRCSGNQFILRFSFNNFSFIFWMSTNHAGSARYISFVSHR